MDPRPRGALEDPLGKALTVKGMQLLLYGRILEAYVWRKENHSDSLPKTWVKYQRHDFCKLNILHNSVLLNDLKQLPYLQPMNGVLMALTGFHLTLILQFKCWRSYYIDTLGELIS